MTCRRREAGDGEVKHGRMEGLDAQEQWGRKWRRERRRCESRQEGEDEAEAKVGRRVEAGAAEVLLTMEG